MNTNKSELIEETVLSAFRELQIHSTFNVPYNFKPLEVSFGGAHTAVIYSDESK